MLSYTEHAPQPSATDCDYFQIDSVGSGLSAASGYGQEMASFISPFSKNGDTLNINPTVMNTDEPYVFRLKGLWYIAVKQADDAVRCYSIDEKNASL